jgi:hypothetical protein
MFKGCIDTHPRTVIHHERFRWIHTAGNEGYGCSALGYSLSMALSLLRAAAAVIIRRHSNPDAPTNKALGTPNLATNSQTA